MATAVVRRLAEDRADSAHPHRPSIEDRRKIVLRGAGKHVGAIHQRKSSLMMAAPGGLHLGSVEFAVRFAIQSVVPDPVCRVQDALENDAFGWNDRRHLTDYHPRNLSPLRECSLFKAAG